MASDDSYPGVPEISISRTSTDTLQSNGSKKKKSTPWKPSAPWISLDRRSYRSRRQGQPRTPTWGRDHSPGPEWKIKWSGHCFPNGRVFIIDYKSSDAVSASGKRHVQIATQEFESPSDLYKFYAVPRKVHGTALRVIHVQNARWATPFLLRKYNIDHPSEMLGMPGFGKWAQFEKPRQRNGKPSPDGRTWRGQVDAWRNVDRTAFGLDYLKTWVTEHPGQRSQALAADQPVDAKMMHLNAYEDNVRCPYGHDVSVQRMSVYIQRSLGPHTHRPPDVDIPDPYARPGTPTADGTCATEDGAKISLEHLDNSNTIIFFDSSASMRLDDCLVQPREEIEQRWRRLTFYLKKEEVINDARLAAQCTNIILSDIFSSLVATWESFLRAASDHVAILEDKIYEDPADESRAPELWMNQATWLKVDKIVYLHSDLVRSMQGNMRELAAGDFDETMSVDWLASMPTDYDKLIHAVSEDLVQPVTNLSDLMYKSVGIRDSRQSLQLGLSMWRLSWITFIFLPLTFIVSFFGMNVDILANNPSVGWYFLSAVILMIFVLILWYCIKHALERSRQTPYQRGLYETMFHNLEDEYPQLWTATGAVPDVQLDSVSSRLKWRLLKRWFSPERTINKRLYSSLDPGGDAAELGGWDSFKRYLLHRWLPQLRSHQRTDDSVALAEIGEAVIRKKYEAETIEELLKASTMSAVAEAEPSAAASLKLYGLRPLSLNRISSPRSSEDRPVSRDSSGMIVEERNLSDSESDHSDPQPSKQQRETSRRASR